MRYLLDRATATVDAETGAETLAASTEGIAEAGVDDELRHVRIVTAGRCREDGVADSESSDTDKGPTGVTPAVSPLSTVEGF